MQSSNMYGMLFRILKGISNFNFLNFDEVKCPTCNTIIDPKLIFNCFGSFIDFVNWYSQDFLVAATYSCIKCKNGKASIVIKNGSEILHCNSCNFEICRKCKSLHPDLACNDFKKGIDSTAQTMKTTSSYTLIAQRLNICPHCNILTGLKAGCLYMTCHLNSSLAFCLFCASKIPQSKGHWTDSGFDCSSENACRNFPKKICPSCTYITVRQGKNNKIKCPKCNNYWCFLCQKMIDNTNPDSHYNGHSVNGPTCPNMPSKTCPYCNNPHPTKEGSILVTCPSNSYLYCYLCSTKFNTNIQFTNQEIGNHFATYGINGLYCINHNST